MNIVFVFDGLQVGGIERVGVDYISLLINHGYTVSVINLNPSLTSFYNFLPKECQIIEHRLPRSMVPYRYSKVVEKGIGGSCAYAGISSLLSFVNVFDKCAFAHLRRKMGDVDVIIAFSGHFNDLYFIAREYLPGKKIAWLHGAEFEYKVISDGYFALYRKIKNLVCLSELCDITCKEFNNQNSIRKVKIYNPILIQEKEVDANIVNSYTNQYGKFVLMAGRLAPDKDQLTAIKAIIYVNKSRKEPVHLVLAGDGDNRKMLESFVIEQQAEEYVHFLGNCMDMQNLYAAAYVYVHSSPMEGLPTVLLEAMAYNVPIASTDSIPGVREILGDSEYGLISPVGDCEKLGDNIEKLLDDIQLRNSLIASGTKRIKEFAPEIAIQKLENLFENI